MGNDASRPVEPPPGTQTPLPAGVPAPMGSIRRMDKVIRKKVRGEITYNMKLLIRGERGTGKTSLLARLQGQPIPETHELTREIQTASIHWSMKGSSEESVKCEVWDVVDVGLKDSADGVDAAMLDSDSQGRHHVAPVDAQNVDVYQNAHGVIFLMDISKYSTLEYVKHQLDLVPVHIPTLIIGTFRDLRRGDDTLKRAIFKEDVQSLLYGHAKDMKNPTFRRPAEQHYFEASLSNCYGLKALHTYLAIPFLHLKVSTVKQQLRLLETDLANAKLDVDATISTQKYSHFVHTIAAGADIRTGRRNPSGVSGSSAGSRPTSATSSTAPSALSRTESTVHATDEDLDDDATSTDLNVSTPRPQPPRPPSPPTPSPRHEPLRPRMPDMEEDDETLTQLDEEARDQSVPAIVVDDDVDDDDLPERGDIAAEDVEPEAPSPLRTEHIQVKVADVSTTGRRKQAMAETSPPSQPTKTSHNTAGKASAAGTKRRSFDKNETLEDFTVSTDMGQFYSDDESSADDEDVVVRTLGQQPRVLRKQNFLYSDSSDTDDDVQETRHGGVVPPDVKAYVAVSPRAMTPPAPTQASAAAEKKSIQPSSTHDHGRSNQGDAKEDKMSDDEGARTTATGHVFCKEEVVDGRAANQEQCKQASDSDEPTTQQVQLSQRRTRRRPPVVEDSDDDIVPSARKGDSSDDSDEVSMTKQTTAASSRRPVVARPGFADSDDSDDGLTADSKRTVLAQTHSTHAEKAQDEESLEDFVPAATPSDSDAASPRESLASRPVLQVAPTPSSKAAADGLSDDDVFLDVILDESDVDSNPPARAPPVAPSALPLPDSSDSDSRPDVVAPSPPVVQRPSISTREIPTTPVESTLPPAMPSLTVVNVMSTQPVDDPTSINHPARHAAGGRAKKRGVKARLDLLDSGSEHSSSPTGRKATHDAAKPPAIAASDGERSSGDQEFVVAKSSSFWSDDDDDDDDKFVTSSSMQRGRNSSPPLAPVKPAIAPTPPASATQMNASVLAAIEEAKRAAIEMLQTTATSTPMPAALLVSTATDVNKPKADKTRKKTLSKRSKAKSAARMHVVASDEDS